MKLSDMRIFGSAATVLATGAALAAATVTVRSIEENDARTVKIVYDLSESAVVTCDIQTNGVSIGAENLAGLAGAVNHKIAAGEGKVILWAADRGWPTGHFTDDVVTARVTAWADNDPPDWMVADLRATNLQEIAFYEAKEQIPWGVTNRLYKTDKLVFRRVRAKGVEWIMGSPSNEVGRTANDTVIYETPHRVTLTNDYYLAIYETTQAQCRRVYNDVMSKFAYVADAGLHPVDAVSCNHVRGPDTDSKGAQWPDSGHELYFNSILGKFRSCTGVEVDLPTMAQWEFACRAGTCSALHSGKDLQNAWGTDASLGEVAWYKGNSNASGSNETQVVGTKLPNAWGFYDMLGNVSEYVLDGYYADSSRYDGRPEIEPVGATFLESYQRRYSDNPTYNRYRYVRGGAHNSDPYRCRSGSVWSSDVWYWASTSGGSNGFRMAAPAVVPSCLKGE